MSHYENTEFQLHTLNAKSVAIMSKHINSLPNKTEGTIFTVWVSTLTTHFVIISDVYSCLWWTVFLYHFDIVKNTYVIFLSQLLYLYEKIFFSKSHLTHLLLLWHAFNGTAVVNTIVQANQTKVIGTNCMLSFS